MKDVLLTGAGGFLGRPCLEALRRRGFRVHAVSSPGGGDGEQGECCSPALCDHAPRGEVSGDGGGEGTSPGRPAGQGPVPARTGPLKTGGMSGEPGVYRYRCDLHREEEVRALLGEVRPHYLLHLAWEVTPGLFWHSGENLRWVRSSLALLEAFAAAGGKRVLAVGTCAEYSWAEGLLREDRTPLEPQTLYGSCKNALRALGEAAAPVYGMSWAWGRLFFLFGPGEAEERLVPAVCRGLLRGHTVPCSHGEQERDYLYVGEAAAALVALLESGVEGSVNIASGRAVKLRHLLERLVAVSGRSSPVVFGARAAPPGEPPLLLAHTGRLNREVGWRPSLSLDEALARTFRWWEEEEQGAAKWKERE